MNNGTRNKAFNSKKIITELTYGLKTLSDIF
jgi:hypothetical protein